MVKRHDKAEDGMYHIKGKVFAELKGSRAKVFNGTAYKTEGGLVKADLIKNKWNRIVSKKKSITAKKEKRLEKAGYTAKKGKFGAVKITKKGKKGKKTRKL